MLRTLAIAATLALFATTGAAHDSADDPAADAGTAVPAGSSLGDQVTSLFESRCASCHGGTSPSSGLVLTSGAFPGSVVGVMSKERDGTAIVAPGDAGRSYLMSKLEGGPDIEGSRMPNGGPYLSPGQLQLVRDWIDGLSRVPPSQRSGNSQKRARLFTATRLVDLPTTETVGASDILLRVSHRFIPAASNGYDPDFFGLNGPANVMLQLSYGLTDDVTVALAHSNLYNEYEAGIAWSLLEQGPDGRGSPLAATLVVSGSLVTQGGGDVFQSGNLKLNAQLPLARGLGDVVSLLVVPSYSTNTNHWSDTSDATVALGVGGLVRIARGLSLTGEWVPVVDGYKAAYDGWATGLDYQIGGHVFQVFATNNTGVLTDQYLPGGYPDLGSSDFRFGFNIFRTFWR
jgi:mono/diheme cytochrome c family protein